MAYLRLLRAQQWVKNIFVFAGLIFGRKFLDPESVLRTLEAFACLCLVSSHVYIVNDIRDRAEDRLHPRKRRRPIAAGEVGVGTAAGVAALLLAAGLAWSALLDFWLLVTVLAYLALQIAYNVRFKHAVILDVICLGLGFVLRAIAGAVVIHVEISHWLVICTFTLCLFMGFSKRRCELNALAGAPEAAATHRRTLSIYTPDLLNHMTTLTAGIAVVSFMLYASDPRTVEKFGSYYLLYTLPLVVYAIFRFAVLVEHGLVDGPTDVVLRDRPFQLAVAAWAILAFLIVYRGAEVRAWLSGL